MLIGYASWRVWKVRSTSDTGELRNDARAALIFYLVMLIADFLWIIFKIHIDNRLIIGVVLIFLGLLTAITAILFVRVDKISGYLFVPYFMCISFLFTMNSKKIVDTLFMEN